jgi:hypothetical protein
MSIRAPLAMSVAAPERLRSSRGKIPSHRYAYTFELKPDWKHFYSYSNEIQQYIEDTYGERAIVSI